MRKWVAYAKWLLFEIGPFICGKLLRYPRDLADRYTPPYPPFAFGTLNIGLIPVIEACFTIEVEYLTSYLISVDYYTLLPTNQACQPTEFNQSTVRVLLIKALCSQTPVVVGISSAFRGFSFSQLRTDDVQLANPFGCASPISFPVYTGVAPSLAANEAESVN